MASEGPLLQTLKRQICKEEEEEEMVGWKWGADEFWIKTYPSRSDASAKPLFRRHISIALILQISTSFLIQFVLKLLENQIKFHSLHTHISSAATYMHRYTVYRYLQLQYTMYRSRGFWVYQPENHVEVLPSQALNPDL